MAEEVRRSPHLLEQFGDDPLDDAELDPRRDRRGGSISYEEQPTPADLLPGSVLAVGRVASTIELIASELGMSIEQDTPIIRLAVLGMPAGDG